MPKGKVKWWNDSKGFGFIEPLDESEDIFVHHSRLDMEGFKTLTEGQLVEYSIEYMEKGPSAADVKEIEKFIDSNSEVPKSKTTIPSQRKVNIFLCHSSGDKKFVRQLYDRLSNVSYISPWLDEKNLLPGQDWEFEISKAVKNADCVIVCLSQNSINKEGFIQKEIRFALDAADEKPEGTIYLIPVRLDKCTPPNRLDRWHYVDLFEESGYERLLLSLQYRATNLGILLSP